MTANTNAVKAAGTATTVRITEREPMLKQRIGSTDYIVSVRFSQSGKETLEPKLLHLIESEVTRIA
jgi:hypothetical protein